MRRPQCIEVQCLFCSGCKEILAVREFFLDRLADTFFFSIPSPGDRGREPFDEKAAQTKQKQTFLRRPRTFSKNSPKGGKADRGGAVCLFVLSAFFLSGNVS